MTKSRRTALVLLGVILCVALPATAQAGRDPLLSGYGGPGSGEQVILGAKLLPGGGGNGGGGSAAANATSLRVPSTAGGSTSAATGGASAGGSATVTYSGKRGKGDKASTVKRHLDELGVATPEIRPARGAAPPVVPYPTRASDAGGPISFGVGLVLGLGALALVLVALGLKRLARPSDPPGEGFAR